MTEAPRAGLDTTLTHRYYLPQLAGEDLAHGPGWQGSAGVLRRIP